MRALALLLGGSHGDVPLVQALKGRGFAVVVAGAAPDGHAHREADRSVLVDYSDSHAIAEVAASVQADLIVPGSNDFAAITAANVGARLGIATPDPPEVAHLFHRKDAFRSAAVKAGIPVPRQFDPEDAASLSVPVIVKPTDLTGGKGVEIVPTGGDLDGAIKRAKATSRSGEVVVEEFVVGIHHGVSSLIAGGQVIFCFFDNELYRPDSFEVAAAASPSTLSSLHKDQVRDAVGRMAHAWRLSDGLVHLQLVVRDQDWFVIDTCRRIPGDLYVDLVRAATGIDYLDGLVSLWTGAAWAPIPSRSAQRGPLVRVCLLAPHAGRFGGVRSHAQSRTRVTEILDRGVAVEEGQKVAIALSSTHEPWKDLASVESTFTVDVLET